MINKEKKQLSTWEGVLLLIALLFTFNTLFAQKALKVLTDDGSIFYINASAVNTITFVTPLAIGDTYQGGIIFYLDASGEHGLVVDTTDQRIVWFGPSETYTITGATGDGVGAGEENTILIEISQGGSGSYAAKFCRDLTLEGYTDWYLPSKSELNLMYTNLKLNGFSSFHNDYYWSSTEFDIDQVWAQDFTNGAQIYANADKYINFYVRAVRAF